MDKINEYTKIMGEWLESPIDAEVVESVEETYLMLKASKAIASSVFNTENKSTLNDLVLDTYNLVVQTKMRNNPDFGADIYINRDILEDVVDNDVETEEEDI